MEATRNGTVRTRSMFTISDGRFGGPMAMPVSVDSRPAVLAGAPVRSLMAPELSRSAGSMWRRPP